MAASNEFTHFVPVTKSSKLVSGQKLGCGRYGEVFKAEHMDWGVVAVKKLIGVHSIPNRICEKLKDEVDKMKFLGHENIINILGITLETDYYCLILKYMENGSLDDFMSRERVGWPLKVRMAKEVILGMNYLHRIRPVIIHRDLKSQNILVDGYIHVKISDFGIAEWKTYSRQYSIDIDQRSQRKGTVTHIPPESWKNINMKANSKFDVYSFGILLWEIMTEKSPFEGADVNQISVCVQNGQRPDVSCILPGAPKFMTEMMRACWHQDPQQRPMFSELKKTMDSLFEEYKVTADRDESDLCRKQVNWTDESDESVLAGSSSDIANSSDGDADRESHKTSSDSSISDSSEEEQSEIDIDELFNTTEKDSTLPRMCSRAPPPSQRNALLSWIIYSIAVNVLQTHVHDFCQVVMMIFDPSAKCIATAAFLIPLSIYMLRKLGLVRNSFKYAVCPECFHFR